MRITILFLGLLTMGCAEYKTNGYVQQDEVNLVPPRIESTNTIIDSSVRITAELRMAGAEIHYTSDGSTPTLESSKYTEALQVSKEGVYKFIALHKDWMSSEISEVKLYKKGVIPKQLEWKTNPNTTYLGQGSLTLVNEKKASQNFRDSQWLGFDTIAKASIKFEQKKFLKSITIGYLVDTKSWIFPPTNVTVYLSSTDSIQVSIPKLEERDLKELRDVQIAINREVDLVSMKIQNTSSLPDWHPGKGLKAWLFMDEWIFN